MTLNGCVQEHFQKRCGKMRKCWLPAFSPLPTMFSTLPRTNFNFPFTMILSSANALNLDTEPHSSVGSVADLRTAGCWFNPGLGQYSLRGLMILVATSLIPLSHRFPLFRHRLCWKGARGLEKILCRSLVKITPGKHAQVH